MGLTLVEKILSNHADGPVKPGEIVDIKIDARIARDFGGANVVKNLRDNQLEIKDPARTYFTFDCNPTGSDQKYATNQQICRIFAREKNIPVYDIHSGIGTHIAIDEGIAKPGDTLVSTDSHANILGAIGAFGQGMGDQDIAAAWSKGRVWFKVPRSMKVILQGHPPENTTSKDIVLRLLQHFGVAGWLGYAVEIVGEAVDSFTLSQRITIASMATEMAGISALFSPSEKILQHYKKIDKIEFNPVYPDPDAVYDITVEIPLDDLEPLISRPGHPEDVVPVQKVDGLKIDSVFIGSCTNGRFEDMQAAGEILRNRKVAPGVVMKIVPATRKIWEHCLRDGLIDIFMQADALVGNAGCAGCAAGQIGQNGPGEITVSTGNRNYTGKQGMGEVYLASPQTAAATAVAGVIATSQSIPTEAVSFSIENSPIKKKEKKHKQRSIRKKSVELRGRIWVIKEDNIDTDMIFHNRYLAITDIKEMGQYTFDNLRGWEDFAQKAKPGDMVITGANFGAGSSRQQAVDCFLSLGIQILIAKSFGAIYERNAVNAGLPILVGDLVSSDLESGEEITVNLKTGEILRHKTGERIQASLFSDIQMQIYQRGGLLR